MLESFAKAIADGLINRTLDTCSRWAEHRVHLPHPFPGLMNFDKFPWQRDILNAKEQMISVQKAAQMGFSITGLVKALFTVAEQRKDVLVVLPNAGIASDFSKARLDAIVNQSPLLANLFLNADSVQLKTTRDYVNMYIRGSISESGLVSVPVGFSIIDEFDRCKPSTMALVMERMSAYEEKQLFALSTPTMPSEGISKLYEQGTKERFVFKCPHCGQHTHLIWPDCMEIRGDCATSDDRFHSYIKCKECNHELKHEAKYEWLKTAKWEKSNNVSGHRSFYINQLYSPALKPHELVEAYFKGEVNEVSKIEFFNQKLGLPYLMEGARITTDLLDSAMKGHSMKDPTPNRPGRMVCMGVDQGTYLDVVISDFVYTANPGNEPHLNSVERVLFAGRFAGSDWRVLGQLMEQWQVQHCCIDFQPETNMAKAFARAYEGYVTLVQYRRGTVGNEIKISMDENRVPTATVDRTNFMDMALGRFHKSRIELPKDTPDVFREHLKAPARTYELDDMGNPRAVYVTPDDKPDHLAHGLTYCEIAHMLAYTQSTGRTIRAGESYFNL